jgi:hypothetical protein
MARSGEFAPDLSHTVIPHETIFAHSLQCGVARLHDGGDLIIIAAPELGGLLRDLPRGWLNGGGRGRRRFCRGRHLTPATGAKPKGNDQRGGKRGETR